MGHALEAGGPFGHIERSAIDDGLAGDAFGAVWLAAIVVTDAPGGIVGRGSDDTDVVSALREPGCHFTCIFADPREFGGVVEAIDKDSQTYLSAAGAQRTRFL